MFNKKEVELIASISLSLYRSKDRIFWKHSKSGSYTVKSSYAIAKQDKHSDGRREEVREETS